MSSAITFEIVPRSGAITLNGRRMAFSAIYQATSFLTQLTRLDSSFPLTETSFALEGTDTQLAGRFQRILTWPQKVAQDPSAKKAFEWSLACWARSYICGASLKATKGATDAGQLSAAQKTIFVDAFARFEADLARWTARPTTGVTGHLLKRFRDGFAAAAEFERLGMTPDQLFALLASPAASSLLATKDVDRYSGLNVEESMALTLVLSIQQLHFGGKPEFYGNLWRAAYSASIAEFQKCIDSEVESLEILASWNEFPTELYIGGFICPDLVLTPVLPTLNRLPFLAGDSKELQDAAEFALERLNSLLGETGSYMNLPEEDDEDEAVEEEQEEEEQEGEQEEVEAEYEAEEAEYDEDADEDAQEDVEYDGEPEEGQEEEEDAEADTGADTEFEEVVYEEIEGAPEGEPEVEPVTGEATVAKA